MLTDYSVINERRDYFWPDGKRLAFCLTTNIEVYAYRKGTGWDPAKKGEPQQQRNYSWRGYRNRVGISLARRSGLSIAAIMLMRRLLLMAEWSCFP